jgi:hypothetical protein
VLATGMYLCITMMVLMCLFAFFDLFFILFWRAELRRTDVTEILILKKMFGYLLRHVCFDMVCL